MSDSFPFSLVKSGLVSFSSYWFYFYFYFCFVRMTNLFFFVFLKRVNRWVKCLCVKTWTESSKWIAQQQTKKSKKEASAAVRRVTQTLCRWTTKTKHTHTSFCLSLVRPTDQSIEPMEHNKCSFDCDVYIKKAHFDEVRSSEQISNNENLNHFCCQEIKLTGKNQENFQISFHSSYQNLILRKKSMKSLRFV